VNRHLLIYLKSLADDVLYTKFNAVQTHSEQTRCSLEIKTVNVFDCLQEWTKDDE